jgi:hypothetical protein
MRVQKDLNHPKQLREDASLCASDRRRTWALGAKASIYRSIAISTSPYKKLTRMHVAISETKQMQFRWRMDFRTSHAAVQFEDPIMLTTTAY